MKRFASIDFLRGLAIVIMLVMHMIGDLLDVTTLMSDLNNIPLINLLALIFLPFLGGLAGFFLLVSAIANMISMTKQLMKGKSVRSMALRQFLGGFIIYIFALLAESAIGYHGAFGNMIQNLNDPSKFDWNILWTGWGNFETIHTIAWCVMINGVVHAILSAKEGWKKPKKQMLIYAILAIIIIAATPFVWAGIAQAYNGFPWGFIESSEPNVFFEISKPHLLKNNFGQVIAAAFFGGLAGPMEPIFPYLAVSFIGSIIGIALAQPKKAMVKGFVKIVLLVGFIMFLTGVIGTALVAIPNIDSAGFEATANWYRYISYHRHWFPDFPGYSLVSGYQNPFPAIPPLLPPSDVYNVQIGYFAWLWQFLVVTGFSIAGSMTVIYLVEFRGRGQAFGEKTKFMRRFGFTAFSVYNNQFIYFLVNGLFGWLFFATPYIKLMWEWVFVQMIIVFLVFHTINKLWEKVNYRGSIEWMIGSIANSVIPSKKEDRDRKMKWYQKGDLRVKGGFYDVEWENIVEEDENYHKNKRDSNISFLFTVCTFIFPVFLPINAVLLPIAVRALKTEGKNRKNMVAVILSSLGVLITIAIALFLGFTTATLLGFSF